MGLAMELVCLMEEQDVTGRGGIAKIRNIPSGNQPPQAISVQKGAETGWVIVVGKTRQTGKRPEVDGRI